MSIKTQLTIATYNVHQCIGGDKREDAGRVAKVIRNLNADIIGIQELGANNPVYAPAGLSQINVIENMTGFASIAGPTIFHPNTTYGNCLLTSLPILATRRHDISWNHFEPRGLLDVELRIAEKTIRVLVTHLGLKSRERREQVRQILSIVSERGDVPTVLMGDFNEWFPWSSASRSLRQRFGRVPYRATFPSNLPFLALDRIWLSRAFKVLDIRAEKNGQASEASDHLPLLAEVEI